MKHTHIDTLADNTPKSRRRVRKTLGKESGFMLSPSHPFTAQAIARQRERSGAEAAIRRANEARANGGAA